MYNLFLDIKCFFGRIKRKFLMRNEPDFTKEELAPLSPETIQDIEETVDEFYNRVPHLPKHKSALFTSFIGVTSVNYINEEIYRMRVRRDCNILISMGYTDFFVSYGTNYGLIAMQEMLRMKKEGYDITVHAGKLYGEYDTLLYNNIETISFRCKCDYTYTYFYPPDFINNVLLNVSAISTEDHLIETNGKIPIDILIYLKKISEGIKNNIQISQKCIETTIGILNSDML